MIETIQTTKLDNGMMVLTEHMPGLRSVTAGVWIRRGARYESAERNGMYHFIEHMVFRGTWRRTALDISVETDRLGGRLDAFTSHELTGFTLKAIDAALPRALDLLMDMVTGPRFNADDLEAERQIIFEEINSILDAPDKLLTRLFNASCFPSHPLGRPIEGTPATISHFGCEQLASFHAAEYVPRNIVVTAAGNLDHERVVELAARACAARAASVGASGAAPAPPAAAPLLIERRKDLEQAHLLMAAPWPSSLSEDRFAAMLLNSVMGGGSSGRLWQSLREERGITSSVDVFARTFSDVGIFTVYAAASPPQLGEVIDLTLAEFRRAVREPVGADELRLAKDRLISSILLALESTGARAGKLARQEIIHGRLILPAEAIREIERVTPADLQRLAAASFQTEKLGVGVLGNVNGLRLDRGRLEV